MIVRQTVGDAPARERTVALGTFDGVHRGHAAVIGQAVERARASGTGSAVVTFHPHPVRVLRPAAAPPELSSPGRRAALLSELGPDELVLVHFTRELAAVEPEDFAADVLAGGLGAVHVVVGENFRFGRGARGDAATLERVGRERGFTVEAVPLLEVDGAPVSSSRIRSLLAAGDVDAAARLLGRPPWVEGAVVLGARRGRTLGYPTANLEPSPRSALPATGIYAGRAVLPGAAHAAAVSVGHNPTFEETGAPLRIEAYLLDFDGDVYGSPIRLELLQRLRDELWFESVGELVAQIGDDVRRTREIAGA